MLSCSERTIERWKRRIADLITTESAKFIAASIPELRDILGVNPNSEVIDIGLTSAEAIIRLKSHLGTMFQTFAIRSKVSPSKVILTF
jgi:hypothetical protein